MTSGPILVAVLLILLILVLAITVPMVYGVMTGKSGNLACKAVADKFVISFFFAFYPI